MSEYISWSPIRRLMKHNGAIIVARDAVDELVDWKVNQQKQFYLFTIKEQL